MTRGRSEAGSAITRTVIGMLALLGLAVIGAAGPTEPRLSLSPDRDFAGAPVRAQASGFLPYEELSWRWDDEVVRGAESADRADTGGSAWTTFWVPHDAEPGSHEVTVTGGSGASASARFIVDPRTDETVYRLPSSTTSTTGAEGAQPGTGTRAEPETRPEASSSTGTSTTTTRDERDVPDQFSVRLEDAGGTAAGGGPPSWLPALGPAAIIALFGGRLFVRHLTREVDADAGEANPTDP